MLGTRAIPAEFTLGVGSASVTATLSYKLYVGRRYAWTRRGGGLRNTLGLVICWDAGEETLGIYDVIMVMAITELYGIAILCYI